MVRLTDRPDMTIDVYRGRKTTIQIYRVNCGCPIQFSAFYAIDSFAPR